LKNTWGKEEENMPRDVSWELEIRVYLSPNAPKAEFTGNILSGF
jgi:hypothetical protein